MVDRDSFDRTTRETRQQFIVEDASYNSDLTNQNEDHDDLVLLSRSPPISQQTAEENMFSENNMENDQNSSNLNNRNNRSPTRNTSGSLMKSNSLLEEPQHAPVPVVYRRFLNFSNTDSHYVFRTVDHVSSLLQVPVTAEVSPLYHSMLRPPGNRIYEEGFYSASMMQQKTHLAKRWALSSVPKTGADTPFVTAKLDFGSAVLKLLEQFPIEKFYGCSALLAHQAGTPVENSVADTVLFCWELKREFVQKGRLELAKGFVYNAKSFAKTPMLEVKPRFIPDMIARHPYVYEVIDTKSDSVMLTFDPWTQHLGSQRWAIRKASSGEILGELGDGVEQMIPPAIPTQLEFLQVWEIKVPPGAVDVSLLLAVSNCFRECLIQNNINAYPKILVKELPESDRMVLGDGVLNTDLDRLNNLGAVNDNGFLEQDPNEDQLNRLERQNMNPKTRPFKGVRDHFFSNALLKACEFINIDPSEIASGGPGALRTVNLLAEQIEQRNPEVLEAFSNFDQQAFANQQEQLQMSNDPVGALTSPIEHQQAGLLNGGSALSVLERVESHLQQQLQRGASATSSGLLAGDHRSTTVGVAPRGQHSSILRDDALFQTTRDHPTMHLGDFLSDHEFDHELQSSTSQQVFSSPLLSRTQTGGAAGNDHAMFTTVRSRDSGSGTNTTSTRQTRTTTGAANHPAAAPPIRPRSVRFNRRASQPNDETLGLLMQGAVPQLPPTGDLAAALNNAGPPPAPTSRQLFPAEQNFMPTATPMNRGTTALSPMSTMNEPGSPQPRRALPRSIRGSENFFTDPLFRSMRDHFPGDPTIPPNSVAADRIARATARRSSGGFSNYSGIGPTGSSSGGGGGAPVQHGAGTTTLSSTSNASFRSLGTTAGGGQQYGHQPGGATAYFDAMTGSSSASLIGEIEDHEQIGFLSQERADGPDDPVDNMRSSSTHHSRPPGGQHSPRRSSAGRTSSRLVPSAPSSPGAALSPARGFSRARTSRLVSSPEFVAAEAGYDIRQIETRIFALERERERQQLVDRVVERMNSPRTLEVGLDGALSSSAVPGHPTSLEENILFGLGLGLNGSRPGNESGSRAGINNTGSFTSMNPTTSSIPYNPARRPSGTRSNFPHRGSGSPQASPYSSGYRVRPMMDHESPSFEGEEQEEAQLLLNRTTSGNASFSAAVPLSGSTSSFRSTTTGVVGLRSSRTGTPSVSVRAQQSQSSSTIDALHGALARQTLNYRNRDVARASLNALERRRTGNMAGGGINLGGADPTSGAAMQSSRPSFPGSGGGSSSATSGRNSIGPREAMLRARMERVARQNNASERDTVRGSRVVFDPAA
ncbi:unnamed protein product [Amoebophrya sp. A120]|nr:unnamed protein product [Amoebophrya sp. A120]|eukprot:GSA120T00014937001.1